MNKPGYKLTSLGWIPEDWEVKRIKDIGKISSGTTPSRNIPEYYADGEIYWVKTTDLNNSIIFNTGEKVTHKALLETSLRIYPKGTVLVAMYGGFNQIGRTGLLGIEATINQALSAITVDLEKTDRRFLLNWFNANVGLWKNFAGSSRKDPNITGNDVGDFPIIDMPLSEQRRIASILSTWDTAIAKEEQLIEILQTRHRALLHELLSGKRRLNGFKNDWKFFRFNEIYKTIKKFVGDNPLLPLSVTKDGIIPQQEYFNKAVTSEDTSNYLVVKRGNMVMSGLNFWMGSIDVLINYEEGMVSPAYKVFEICNSSVSEIYMLHFARSRIMLQALIGSSVVGASIVRRNMDRETLEEWAFHLPPLPEQTAIASVLSTSEKEIQIHRRRLAALQQQKKGLMQVLLTGKVRVKAAEP
ncbi:MAG TPA: restriction endonuclease subunit S [Puia sp.]|nr:restriction endonuclease subunit S [Puia sp.]